MAVIRGEVRAAAAKGSEKEVGRQTKATKG
jgi:hypothetical protein